MKGDAVNCGVCRQIVDMTCANCSALRIATLERELAEARRQRDALKAGKWAGAWEAMPPTLRWARFGAAGVKAEVGPGDSGWWHWTDSGNQDRDDSLDAAKAAADAHLLAAGWYLADAPKPETPCGVDGCPGTTDVASLHIHNRAPKPETPGK